MTKVKNMATNEMEKMLGLLLGINNLNWDILYQEDKYEVSFIKQIKDILKKIIININDY